MCIQGIGLPMRVAGRMGAWAVRFVLHVLSVGVHGRCHSCDVHVAWTWSVEPSSASCWISWLPCLLPQVALARTSSRSRCKPKARQGTKRGSQRRLPSCTTDCLQVRCCLPMLITAFSFQPVCPCLGFLVLHLAAALAWCAVVLTFIACILCYSCCYACLVDHSVLHIHKMPAYDHCHCRDTILRRAGQRSRGRVHIPAKRSV